MLVSVEERSSGRQEKRYLVCWQKKMFRCVLTNERVNECEMKDVYVCE